MKTLLVTLLLFASPIPPQGVSKLHDRINKVCPIQGVSIPDPMNKTSWRVDYNQEATPAQRSAAVSVIATWTDTDWDPPSEKRSRKYVVRVDPWTLAITRYQIRLLDSRLTSQQKAKIQGKLDSAIQKVQDESIAIETEDPD